MEDKKKYVTLTERNFQAEVLESGVPVMVDFWADWCGPCHIIAPVIEKLAAEFEGQVRVGKLNVEDNQTIAAQYGVRSIPTLLFFKDGEVADQLIGAVPRGEIIGKLQALLNAD